MSTPTYPSNVLGQLGARAVWLWGTGSLAAATLTRLDGRFSVAGVIHGRGPAPGPTWHGLRVAPPDDVLSPELPRPFVVVCSMYVHEIGADLERRGFRRGIDWCAAGDVALEPTDRRLTAQIERWREMLTRPSGVHVGDLAQFDDAFWLWLNTQMPGADVSGGLVPPLPAEEIQERLTGAAGGTSLTHGFNQYRLMRQLAREAGVDFSHVDRLLDFGCGYGRIVRFFRKDAPQADVVGVDVSAMLVEWCRAHLPFGTWHLVPALPPTDLPTGHCSLVVSFSVFTHLSEVSHLAWLEEIHRWLVPGGVAVVTLWTHPSASRPYHEPHFPDFDALIADFDDGRFSFSNLRYGATATYGEAFVPRAWVDRVWTRWFDVVGWLEHHPDSPSQTHVALRRR